MQKQVVYGIVFSCIGIAIGFAIGFPVINTLPYEKRGYMGVPLMLLLCIGFGIGGAIAGIRIAGPEFPEK